MNEHRLKKQRSKNKGKERRAELKAEASRIKEGQKLVKLAQEVADPLAKFPSFQKFERNGVSCRFIYKRVGDMDAEMVEWAIDLTKQNMQPLYEKSKEGWKENMKREEMTEDAACFLVAIDIATDKPVGFSHFRFDMDYGVEVLYCYELQLEAEWRQKGLGRFMLQVLELMAFTNQMSKVVLTVFKHNGDGFTFFTKCKYVLDDTSPEDSYDETFDYCILSKENKIKQSQKTSL